MKERVNFVLGSERRYNEAQGGPVDMAEFLPQVQREPGHWIRLGETFPGWQARLGSGILFTRAPTDLGQIGREAIDRLIPAR